MKNFISKRKLRKAYEDMQLIVHKYIEHIEYLDLVIKRQEVKIERISKENEQQSNAFNSRDDIGTIKVRKIG